MDNKIAQKRLKKYLLSPMPHIAKCICAGYTIKEGTYNLLGITQKSNSVKQIKLNALENSVDLDDYDIRKLTERECFRFMGLDDKHIDIIQGTGISMCQQYKMAGNSIVVDVLSAIYNTLFTPEQYTKEKPLKVFTTFSGYDSQCIGLEKSNIHYDLVGWSEIDKYAIQTHNALFPEYEDKCYSDITKIDWDKIDDFDFLTYSSPCQDISNAGKQKGLGKGSNTRSSLLWYVEDAIKSKKPKFLLMENVKGLTSKKFMPYFEKWLHLLEQYGYKSYWKILNAKDYGVPQNRNRVFVVSIREPNSEYVFPAPIPLKKCFQDFLEKEVSERYYITDKQKNSIKTKLNI